MTETRSCAEQSRRMILKGAAGLGGLGLALGLAPGAMTRALAQAGAGPNASQDPGASSIIPMRAAPKKGTQLVMLGTAGGPGVDLARAQTATAVVIDGKPYLVDCGYGTVRDLVACGLGYLTIDNVFFTHLHNDHTLDLPAMLSLQWTGNKMAPTDAHGPFGTKAMVAAAVDFFKADVGIRIADEGRTIDPVKQFHGHDLKATDKPAEAFKNDEVTVSSIENAHFPERSKAQMPYRSIAFRFDSKDRSIVFTGDTAYTENLVELARGADIYVSEVMDQLTYDQMSARAREEAAKGNPNNIFRHVADTHSTPTDVGRIARAAKVKMVVLNHLLPGGTRERRLNVPISTFIDGVRKEFDGEVVVAEDLMVI
jgi:ribonuclease BN (tRNA processing enzyme)